MPTWITMNVTEKYVKYKYVPDMQRRTIHEMRWENISFSVVEIA